MGECSQAVSVRVICRTVRPGSLYAALASCITFRVKLVVPTWVTRDVHECVPYDIIRRLRTPCYLEVANESNI